MSTRFEPDYAAARADFAQAAREAGASLESHPHPLRGPAGEALAVDTAWLGPRDAERVLVTVSATHGVEGIYGSACQRAHLRRVAREGLPEGQAMLVVHALNPHGYAWSRRVDHENIDVNRNHVDFTRPLPANPGYATVHRMLDALEPTAAGVAAFEQAMGAFVAREGRAAVAAATGGQHTHPDGIFFGGLAPSWSRRTLEAIVGRWLRQARAIAVLDHHTGLGPHGHTEIICRHPVASRALALARGWYGSDVTSPGAGESQSAAGEGGVRDAFDAWCPQALVVAVALEVGTIDERLVFFALVADHVLRTRGEPSSPAAEAVRRRMRAAFYCDDDAWRERVLRRSMELHDAAQAGLASLDTPSN